jgi:hypothetical protein
MTYTVNLSYDTGGGPDAIGGPVDHDLTIETLAIIAGAEWTGSGSGFGQRDIDLRVDTYQAAEDLIRCLGKFVPGMAYSIRDDDDLPEDLACL